MIISSVKVGDEVAFLDSDSGYERRGTVTSFQVDAGHGFAGFVCWDDIRQTHCWGYVSQIITLNGVEIA